MHVISSIFPSVPTASSAGYEKSDFLKEIDMMKLVAEGNNTHVVSFVGCVTVQEPLCLITEFVRHGDLLSYLQNIRRMVSVQPLLIEMQYEWLVTSPPPLRAMSGISSETLSHAGNSRRS